MSLKKGVSIIVCCYNSSALITETLIHIARQKINPNFSCELILVDNASNDDTVEVAKAVWTKLNNQRISLNIVSERVRGLANARTKGIASSAYEYIVFCDDDNWLDENYANTAFDYFEEHPDIAIIGGCGYPVFEKDKPVWFDKFSSNYALGPQANSSNTHMTTVYGAGLCARKRFLKSMDTSGASLFLSGRTGGSLTSGDDSEICFKAKLAGYNIAYLDNLTFKHYLPSKRLTWAYLKKLNIGFAKSYVIINLYSKALASNNLKLPIFYWLKMAFYYTGIYVKYWIKHYLAYRKTEGTVEEIRQITWKIIALTYLQYNFKTVGIYKLMATYKTNRLN